MYSRKHYMKKIWTLTFNIKEYIIYFGTKFTISVCSTCSSSTFSIYLISSQTLGDCRALTLSTIGGITVSTDSTYRRVFCWLDPDDDLLLLSNLSCLRNSSYLDWKGRTNETSQGEKLQGEEKSWGKQLLLSRIKSLIRHSSVGNLEHWFIIKVIYLKRLI